MRIYLSILFTLFSLWCLAADVFESDRARWLRIAEESKPELHSTIVKPEFVVSALNDTSAFQHWRYRTIGSPDSLLYGQSFKTVREITLDFGRHMVGYFSFKVKTLSRCLDAPIRLKFFFGELPAEINTPLDPWPGQLSRGWMQDEIVNVHQSDTLIEIPRRLAFRYLKIELLGASADYDFALENLQCRAVSSADRSAASLLPGCSPRIAAINGVGEETLRECMQTVFEDGPKRDRRLWAGDLYLQSLANRYSFRNFDLVKRCLYLFAGLSDGDGNIISNIFETPVPHEQTMSHCLSYSLLWNATLCEYFVDTNDVLTVCDLWPVARRQIEEALTYVGDDGIFRRESRPSYAWTFFDWREGLDTTTPMQGAVIYAIDQTLELAKRIGKVHEVSHWAAISRRMKKAAKRNLFDSKRGLFVSGPDRQISALSQTWMIKAGVVAGREARVAIENALADPTALLPGTPYGAHYLVEAMILAGMNANARQYLENYWGGMVDKGADTFWESYDPNDDFISAYSFFPVNSACHAWSCTPVYFINKYPQIFQTDLDQ